MVRLYNVGRMCARTMCTCTETDRFEQCALVGDDASLGGGSSECLAVVFALVLLSPE